ncbi:family 2 encapsulin nanocompartment cargo protein terpene cyclase [Nocardia wallacei]|uniref:family 2 encapsulin nanocompartment cargo protein terpene cyclase n=1 Tax=Nocardia wallacei TaxID=480035 RepID=UPI0024559A91|nr:family 2 encapsulin nanocompartment cargo protein terpene cyclase [Nocardia wallacei]
MSVLSRAAAPPATGEVAAVVAALLTNLDHAPPARLAVPDEAEPEAPQQNSGARGGAAVPEKAEPEAPRRAAARGGTVGDAATPDKAGGAAARPATADLGGMVGAAVPHGLLGPTGLGAPYLPRPPGRAAVPTGPADGAAAHSPPTTDHTAAPADSASLDEEEVAGGEEGTPPDESQSSSGAGRIPTGPAPTTAEPPGDSGIQAALDRLLSGRTDLTRMPSRPSTAEPPRATDEEPQRSRGPDSTRRQPAIPPLYCPPPVRDDPALAAAVNEGILLWAETIGLYEGKLDELRKADFGRLIMLAHPDCDDPDRLLAVAKCAVSEWSVDDYYCEEDADDHAPDGTPSSAEAELGPRLELAAAAIDPVHLPARYQLQLERAMQADPILRAFRTSFEHLSHYATPAQLARLRTEIGGWFIALGAEAGWRTADRMPPVWEYLTNRQPHSFLPCMAPIDVVGGYELSAPEYTDPRVRRVVTTAALAAQMVNDLYSMAREDLSGGREFNLPTVLAAEERCPRREAVRRTAEIHDELVHRFEREAAALAATGSPALRRFLGGLWAWMGGNRAWHADSRRYHEKD